MALIECHECGGRISDTAAACPHCGAPLPRLAQDGTVIREQLPEPPKKRKSNATLLLAVLLVVIALAMIGRAINSSPQAPAQPAASDGTAEKWQRELETIEWPETLKTEELRRAYYDAVCDAEDRYLTEAEQAFPTDMTMPRGISQDEQFKKQMQRMTELKTKYLGEVRERFQVTDALAEQLTRESIIKRWRPKD